MSKQIISAIKIASLALFFTLGVTAVYAWVGPTAQPPTANVDVPINTSLTLQKKLGDLNVGNFISLVAASGNITGSNVIANSVAANSLLIPTGAAAGKVLTSDATGNATWGAGGGAGAVDPTPIGGIISYAGTTPPTGYLFCDGASLLRTDYPDLFAAISTTYGAADASHFSLPDLRGEFVRGLDRGKMVDAPGGVTRALGSWEAEMFKNHTHPEMGSAVVNGGSNGTYQPAGNASNFPTNTYSISTGQSSTGGTETRPRNVALNYIIKATNNGTMVLVASPTTITAGTGVTISPVGPKATGDVTINAVTTSLTAGAGVTLSPPGPGATGVVTISAPNKFIDYGSGVAIPFNTVGQASSNGYLNVVLSGSWKNCAQLVVGKTSTPNIVVGLFGDDNPGFTKAATEMIPIRSGDYYILKPATVGACSGDPFESVSFTFFPVN